MLKIMAAGHALRAIPGDTGAHMNSGARMDSGTRRDTGARMDNGARIDIETPIEIKVDIRRILKRKRENLPPS